MYQVLSQVVFPLRLVFLSSALVGLLLGLGLDFALTLVLHVLIVNAEGLVDLSTKSLVIIEPEIMLVTKYERSQMWDNLQAKEFSVVHLQKHTSDLASQLRLLALDLGVQSLTKHLLLLRGRDGTKRLGSQTASNRSFRLSSGMSSGVLSATATTAHLDRHATTATTESTAHRHARYIATATSTEGLHLSHSLRVGHAVRNSTRAHSTHGDTLSEVRRHLLVGTHATATLLRERRVLARTSTRDTSHDHTGLRRESQATTLAGGYEALLTRTVENGGLHVLETCQSLNLWKKIKETYRLGHSSRSSSLLLSDGVASLNAGLELASTDILALGKGNVEGLAVDHSLVHLGHGLRGLIGAAEADETEALALPKDLLLRLLVVALGFLLLFGLLSLLLHILLLAVFFLLRLRGLDALDVGSVAHHLGGGNGAVRTEELTELLIVNVIGQVLHVEVDTLVLGGFLQTGSLVLLAQFILTLVLLLSTANVELLAIDFLVVHLFHGGLRTFVGRVVDETKTTALAILVAAQSSGGDLTILLKEVTELLIGNLEIDILDVNVGEVGLHLLELALAVLLGDVVADEDLLVVQKHAIDVLDGVVGSVSGLVVDETVALGVTEFILGNLAAENVAKGGESVMEGLVVNGIVKVLDEDVALASLAQSGVTLRPHDTAGLALDESIVQVLESALTISGVVVVDIGVTERATGDGITADTDGSDLADGGEELVEHGLGDGGVELTNIERSRVGLAGSGGSRLSNRSLGSRAGGLGSTVDGVLSGGSGRNVGRHLGFLECFFFLSFFSGWMKQSVQVTNK